MISLIRGDLSVDDNYTRLLTFHRKLAAEEREGSSVCAHCGRTKRDHIHDGRCSVWMLSKEFMSTRRSDRHAINRALHLIEQLRNLKLSEEIID